MERPRGGAQFATTRRDMLRSRALARATIDRLELWDHPDFGGVDQASTWNPFRAARRALFSVRSALFPSDAVGNDAAIKESSAVSRLMENLEVGAGRNSRIVEIAFSSRDPQVAAGVANTLARIYIERDMEFRYMSSRSASSWLQQRITEQRAHLEASEQELQRYREDHGAAAIEDRQNMIVRELADLHSAVTEATMSRIGSEARYRELEAAQDDFKVLERFPEILENSLVQEQMLNVRDLQRERIRLAEDYGPLHPVMVRVESSIEDADERLRNEVATIVDSVRLEYQVARVQEQELGGRVRATDRGSAGARPHRDPVRRNEAGGRE